jgi:hypothetical protein
MNIDEINVDILINEVLNGNTPRDIIDNIIEKVSYLYDPRLPNNYKDNLRAKGHKLDAMINSKIGESSQGKESRDALLKQVSKKQDKNGYYVCTHRCRSKSYPSIAEIPVKVLKFIASTG